MAERAALERVAQRVEPGARLLRAWRLEDGVSARLTALEVRLRGGSRRTFVVRQHGAADRAADPRSVAHEFRLLQLLSASGIPVPAPRYVDESGEILRTPYLVVDFVESDRRPAADAGAGIARQLATALAEIHRLGVPPPDLSFLPRQEDRVAARLANRAAARTIDEERVLSVLSAAWPRPEGNEPALLHGDFWPGNALWKDGKLVAIVDWEDAAVGDPLADLGNCRLELMWAHGDEAVSEFTKHYQRAMRQLDFSDLPYWDLYAYLRLAPHLDEWGLDAGMQSTMRERHELFVADALRQLARGRG